MAIYHSLSYASHTMNMYILTEGTHIFIARCTLFWVGFIGPTWDENGNRIPHNQMD